jgi:hypothetical protein
MGVGDTMVDRQGEASERAIGKELGEVQTSGECATGDRAGETAKDLKWG